VATQHALPGNTHLNPEPFRRLRSNDRIHDTTGRTGTARGR
jgi:hypothetical protein